ncbi:MAG: acetyltransferase [Planctomycetota bacterium]|nr:acetyltransferase [Planctomycetota bacterium]
MIRPLLIGLSAALLLALPAPAGPRKERAGRKVVVCESARWERTERLEIDDPRLVQERFVPIIEHHDAEIVAAFDGDRSPPSSRVLLHVARGAEAAPHPVPVLLVHGAGVNANHCWADRPVEQPYEGLAARLVRAGRKAFALTFAHPHGDNHLQAEALTHVIDRVRELTGAAQVDLVAWSKGGMSSRIYLSDAGPEGSTRYRGDVRRYVMLGTPNGGIDVSFAYPNLNYWILEHKTPAPLSWTRYLYYGTWVDAPERSIYGLGAFPGQAQMVARWDQRYGRTRSAGQYDVDATYDGTKGLVSVSLGIDRAIADGGDLIARLKKKPVHPDVALYALAGTHPWISGEVGERRGPSDGLVLVASVFDLEPMTKRGARVARKDLRALNHLQLAYDPRANDWVADALAE